MASVPASNSPATVELIQRAVPLPHQGQELKEKDAVLRVRGLLAHLLLELAQGFIEVTLAQPVFG